MYPQEKAKELVDKIARIDGYLDSIDLSTCEFEKKCALILVNEILESDCGNNTGDFVATDGDLYLDKKYWIQVKKEIEKL